MADLGAYVVEVVARDRAGNRVARGGRERDITARLTDDDAAQRSLIIAHGDATSSAFATPQEP